MVAMVGIMALPALAYHEGYDHSDRYGDEGYDHGDRYGDYGYDDDDNGYDDDDNGYDEDDYDRYPPGYDDREEEPSAPDCDWYYYEDRRWDDGWYEYWCWYGRPYYEWYFVLWVWA